MKTKHSLAKSFRFALAGFTAFLGRERNGRVEAAIAVAALGLCLWYRVNVLEWCLVLLCSAGVLAVEAMNTALEALADALHPKRSPEIGRAKDMAAAAVLIMACASAVIGSLIFGPRLLASIHGL